jgi:hypothetical protein
MALKKITQEELDEVLKLHVLWLSSSGREGKKAILNSTNLSDLDLSRYNLKRANFHKANLNGANLNESFLKYVDLREANLQDAYLQDAYLDHVDLRGADLTGAFMQRSSFRNADFFLADLYGVDLQGAIYSDEDLRRAVNVNPKWFKGEIKERRVSNQLIDQLRAENKKFSEKAKELEKEREQGQINEEEFKKQNQDLAEKNKLLEQQLIEAEERARREITKDNIDKAINALKNPNAYIENQITIQNILAFIYGVFALMSFIVMIRYISVKYEVFGSLDFQKATIISWLFYVSPIVLLGSLAIALINQVNHRLKRILVLNERKRYVEAMGGALKATVELSETDADAREKIEGYMDTIVKNTISRKVDVLNLEETESDEIKSLEVLDKIKSLLKNK